MFSWEQPPMMYMINSNGLIDGGQYLYEYRERIAPYRLLCRRIFENSTDAVNFLKEMRDSLPIESQYRVIQAINHCIAELETINYRTTGNFTRIDYSIPIERPGSGKITLRELHTNYRKVKRIIYDEDDTESTDTENRDISQWIHKSNYRDTDDDMYKTCYYSNCKSLSTERTPYCPNCGKKME